MYYRVRLGQEMPRGVTDGHPRAAPSAPPNFPRVNCNPCCQETVFDVVRVVSWLKNCHQESLRHSPGTHRVNSELLASFVTLELISTARLSPGTTHLSSRALYGVSLFASDHEYSYTPYCSQSISWEIHFLTHKFRWRLCFLMFASLGRHVQTILWT